MRKSRGLQRRWCCSCAPFSKKKSRPAMPGGR